MRLTTAGVASNIHDHVVGRITTRPTADRSESIIVTTVLADLDGYRGVITTNHDSALSTTH
jgi:hypothetical protein